MTSFPHRATPPRRNSHHGRPTRPVVAGREVSLAIAEYLAEQALGVCPRCGGSGEIHHHGSGRNPYCGLRTPDPQNVVDETCPRCKGTGVR